MLRLRDRILLAAFGLGLLIAAFAPSPASACDCAQGEPTVAEARVKLAIIVHGRVLSTEASAAPGSYTARVFVLRAWKGAAAGDTMAIPIAASSCGYAIAPGDELLIYAPAGDPVAQCAGDRTARLRMGAGLAEDVAALGPALGAAATPPAAVGVTKAEPVVTGRVTALFDSGRRGFEMITTRGGRGFKVRERVRVWSPIGACAQATVLAAQVGDVVSVEGRRLPRFGSESLLVSGCDGETRARVIRGAARVR